jgi:hypothetical protein
MDATILAAGIGVLGVVVGVVATNLANTANLRLQLAAQQQDEWRRLQLARLEELFLLVEVSTQNLIGELSDFHDFLIFGVDVSSGSERPDQPLYADKSARMTMIVRLFFPSLYDRFKEFDDVFGDSRSALVNSRMNLSAADAPKLAACTTKLQGAAERTLSEIEQEVVHVQQVPRERRRLFLPTS